MPNKQIYQPARLTRLLGVFSSLKGEGQPLFDKIIKYWNCAIHRGKPDKRGAGFSQTLFFGTFFANCVSPKVFV